MHGIISSENSLPLSLDVDAVADGGALRWICCAVLSANGCTSTRALKSIISVEHQMHETVGADDHSQNCCVLNGDDCSKAYLRCWMSGGGALAATCACLRCLQVPRKDFAVIARME